MEFIEISAKTVNDAITEACKRLTVTSDRLEYEVIQEGSTGFLGFNAKPAIIKAGIKEDKPVEDVKPAASAQTTASVKETVKKDVPAGVVKSASEVEQSAKEFLKDVFAAMNLTVQVTAKFDEANNSLDVDLAGDEMGVLIGKRGQTLDSVQYLVSLVVNKGTSEYIRVKVDTENYRQRRRETLENLAKNISYKVKRTKRPVSLEPMNPYERRIIHSALQNDKYVTTHSEGEEPFRRVVITLKR